MSDVVLIGGAAAVALYAAGQREEGKVIAPRPPIGLAPLSGVSVSLKASLPGGRAPLMASAPMRYLAPQVSKGTGGAGNPDAKITDQALGRAAAEYIKENVDKLSPAAKKAGAAKLNEALKLNPPLTGNESYEQIAKVVGSSAGAAACAAVGAGLASPLCAMAGAYLGVKGVDLAKRAAAKIEQKAKDLLNSVEDKARDIWNSIF